MVTGLIANQGMASLAIFDRTSITPAQQAELNGALPLSSFGFSFCEERRLIRTEIVGVDRDAGGQAKYYRRANDFDVHITTPQFDDAVYDLCVIKCGIEGTTARISPT